MTKEVIQGSANHFGPRFTEVDSPVDVPTVGLVRTIVLPIYTTAGSAALNVAPSVSDTINLIPASSLIKTCYIYTEDAFTSTAVATGIDVGLYKASDGTTAIDADGLIAVGGVGAKANLTALGWDAGDGALIGAEVTAFDAIIKGAWAAGTDTLTGTGVIVVEFIPPLTHLLGNKT